MSLISYGTAPTTEDSEDAEKLTNNGFWPDIDAADFLSCERVDSTMTEPRVLTALRSSINDINRQLASWQMRHQAAGITSADDVPAPSWATDDYFITLYQRAVYSTAKAFLLEQYRDVSATPAGDQAGEAKNSAADDIRRNARWAVSEILGQTHCTVELI